MHTWPSANSDPAVLTSAREVIALGACALDR